MASVDNFTYFYRMEDHAQVIARTQNWIRKVVIGCNFCPFAAREMKQGRVHFQAAEATTITAARDALLQECRRLDKDTSIGTTLLIFSSGFTVFEDYLGLVTAGEKLLRMKGYDGVYQLASFHPDYRFADADADDPANYTNRSIYPMLHLLRERDVRKALQFYPHPENIPVDNVRFAREKGAAFMQLLKDGC